MDEVIVNTYFDIVPSYDGRCVFKGVGFNINDVKMITQVEARSVMDHLFYVYIGYSEEFKLEFSFKRQKFAEAARGEFARAWTRTGEFSDEYKERLGA